MLVIVILKDMIEEDRHWLSNAPLDRRYDMIAMTHRHREITMARLNQHYNIRI